MRPHIDPGAALLLVLLCALWGIQVTAAKVAAEVLSPWFQTGLRSLIAAAAVMVWALLRGEPLYRRDGTLGWGVLVGAIFSIEFVLLYAGLAQTQAGRGTVILFSCPFFVAIGAHLLIPGERLSWLKVGGLGVAFAGLLLTFADALRAPAAHSTLTGDLLVLGGAMTWAATTLIIKASPLIAVSAVRVLLYQLLVSGVVLTPLAYLLGDPVRGPVEGRHVLAMGYQSVIVAGASYLAWFWLLGRYPAAKLSAFTFLAPVFGVAAAAVLGGEALDPTVLAACALIALGIILVNRAQLRPVQATAPGLGPGAGGAAGGAHPAT